MIDIPSNLISPWVVKPYVRSYCDFCKRTFNINELKTQQRHITTEFGWNYCINCSDICSQNVIYYHKINSVLSYSLFYNIIENIKLPNTFKVIRSSGVMEDNWIFYKYISDDYFIKWVRGEWLFILTNGSKMKYVSLANIIKHNLQTDIGTQLENKLNEYFSY